jgi:hypothetical protein
MIDARLGILIGAAGEVGKAAARQFAESGWSLILCDRSDSVVAQGEALAKEFGRTVIGVKMDLLQDAEIERVVGLAQETGIPLTSCSRPRVAIALAASAGLRYAAGVAVKTNLAQQASPSDAALRPSTRQVVKEMVRRACIRRCWSALGRRIALQPLPNRALFYGGLQDDRGRRVSFLARRQSQRRHPQLQRLCRDVTPGHIGFGVYRRHADGPGGRERKKMSSWTNHSITPLRRLPRSLFIDAKIMGLSARQACDNGHKTDMVRARGADQDCRR